MPAFKSVGGVKCAHSSDENSLSDNAISGDGGCKGEATEKGGPLGWSCSKCRPLSTFFSLAVRKTGLEGDILNATEPTEGVTRTLGTDVVPSDALRGSMGATPAIRAFNHRCQWPEAQHKAVEPGKFGNGENHTKYSIVTLRR